MTTPVGALTALNAAAAEIDWLRANQNASRVERREHFDSLRRLLWVYWDRSAQP